MEGRKRISVVAGQLADVRLLSQFISLSKYFDTKIYLFNHDRILDALPKSVEVVAFEPDHEMPGYMRGLEREIEGSAAIIALETTSLSSFQALRMARKNELPFIVYSTEWVAGLYDSFPNIRAVQHDLVENSELFLVPCPSVSSCLLAAGANEQRIYQVPLRREPFAHRKSEAGRKKFRRYLGWGESDLVLMFEGKLEPYAHPEVALHAFELLVKSGVCTTADLKLVFVGSGSLDITLKADAHKSGVGRQVFFLSQDTAEFAADLFSSVDVSICPNIDPCQEAVSLPFSSLEHLAFGAIPIFTRRSLHKELLGAAGITVNSNRFEEFALALSKTIASPGALAEARIQIAEAAQTATQESDSERLAAVVYEELKGSRSVEARSERRRREVSEARNLIDLSRNDEALVIIERLLLEVEETGKIRGEVLSLKGEVLYTNGELEGAADAFQASLAFDSECAGAYRGLGFIAWRNFADDDAVVFFKRAMAYDDSDPRVMFGLGLIHHRSGLSELALHWLEKAVTINSKDRAIISSFIQVCSQCSDPAMGIAAIARVTEFVGESPSLLIAHGGLLMREGKIAEGKEMVSRALAIA